MCASSLLRLCQFISLVICKDGGDLLTKYGADIEKSTTDLTSSQYWISYGHTGPDPY